MAKVHVKTGDTVVVLSGNSKGVKGKVIAVSPKEGKVLVEGANMVHKHVKARKQGDVSGIVDAEGAMYASKVALFCSKCGKGVRVKHIVSYTEKNGKKVRTVKRVCAKCGTEL